MATLRAHGIAATLPQGFEGRIYRRPAHGPEQTHPVAQFATFPLPPGVGDFGGGAVDVMGPLDVLVVLFEYGPESLGAPLFARQGMPRQLAPDHFRPYTLRRGVGGQSGTQWFFTEQGRPFTLYAVLGGHGQRFRVVPRLNQLLAAVEVGAPGATGVPGTGSAAAMGRATAPEAVPGGATA